MPESSCGVAILARPGPAHGVVICRGTIRTTESAITGHRWFAAHLRTHGVPCCQEGVLVWPGDFGAVGWEMPGVVALLAAAGLVPARGPGSSWSARSLGARQGAGEDERA